MPAVFDTGTVIVDAEVTATVDETVVLVCDDDLVVPPEEEEDRVDEDAASTYSVEVIVAAFVVVGGLVTESDAAAAVGLRADAVEEAVAVATVTAAAGVDSEPFAWSNDSSVFVDLSAVVLADVLVVHFITDEWQVDVDTLLELLLLLLLLLVAVAIAAVAVSLLLLLLLLVVIPVVSPAAAEDEGGWSRGPAAALTSLLVAAAEAVAFF